MSAKEALSHPFITQSAEKMVEELNENIVLNHIAKQSLLSLKNFKTTNDTNLKEAFLSIIASKLLDEDF